ncbi:hypothetical protein FNV43_RR11431 [Rhamnella rubrinervis]|uniref:Uncharacterized protein n=1 Tax=Rhamnella rubrinervis TaxID=2594499 RepID=A0A8K0H5I3_9ROSA|nr:hypothetical protein FNV43_RR11431 [Rhamnella rubrinervis]
MSSMVSKTQTNSREAKAIVTNDMVQEPETQNPVTSHLYIKPTHSTEPLDKEVVLRRIRRRKRVNKLRAALEAFFSPFLQKPNKASMPESDKKWMGDDFAAP